ncbi:hypothetical protein JHK82_043460 [Glycine max]|nr:hypothetical protein JHK82_043460 [Glycine max]
MGKGASLEGTTVEEMLKSFTSLQRKWHCVGGLQSGHSVLPKSVNESRIKENLSLFDWCIPPELLSKLSQIHQEALENSVPSICQQPFNSNGTSGMNSACAYSNLINNKTKNS